MDNCYAQAARTNQEEGQSWNETSLQRSEASWPVSWCSKKSEVSYSIRTVSSCHAVLITPHSVQKSWVQIENVCFLDCQWASYRKNNNHLDPCPCIFHGYYFVYSWSAHQIPSFINQAPCEDVPRAGQNFYRAMVAFRKHSTYLCGLRMY